MQTRVFLSPYLFFKQFSQYQKRKAEAESKGRDENEIVVVRKIKFDNEIHRSLQFDISVCHNDIGKIKEKICKLKESKKEQNFGIFQHAVMASLRGHYFWQHSLLSYADIKSDQHGNWLSCRKFHGMFMKQEISNAYKSNPRDTGGNIQFVEAVLALLEGFDCHYDIFGRSAAHGNIVSKYFGATHYKKTSLVKADEYTKWKRVDRITTLKSLMEQWGCGMSAFALSKIFRGKQTFLSIDYCEKALELGCTSAFWILKEMLSVNTEEERKEREGAFEVICKKTEYRGLHDLYQTYLADECRLMVLFLGRQKNPKSPFYRDSLPLDIFKVIARYANIAFIKE